MADAVGVFFFCTNNYYKNAANFGKLMDGKMLTDMGLPYYNNVGYIFL